MIEKAVAALKADKARAIDMFNKGEGGFKDRDLYVFCFNVANGKLIAGQASLLGTDVRTLKDKSGKVFGEEIFNSAKEGAFTEVGYMFPRPGQTELVQKVSYVTKIGDIGCGVGYYNRT